MRRASRRLSLPLFLLPPPPSLFPPCHRPRKLPNHSHHPFGRPTDRLRARARAPPRGHPFFPCTYYGISFLSVGRSVCLLPPPPPPPPLTVSSNSMYKRTIAPSETHVERWAERTNARTHHGRNGRTEEQPTISHKLFLVVALCSAAATAMGVGSGTAS